MDLITVARRLRRETAALTFGGEVAHVYRPLDYAWAPHRLYLQRFGAPPREVLLVGMNPGPHGMVQTGVPFGEVEAVRDWLGLEAPVKKPAIEHPRRPVEGFACTRSEVSGRRLWSWARDRFGRPEHFFARFFVYNYCPLAFLAASGRNITPDKLATAEREALAAPCDRALAATVAVLQPRLVIGIGAYAARRIAEALPEPRPRLGKLLHPSPASPAANRGWAPQAERALRELGVKISG
jgi:single-strand selective monofunctional uracil DNA glycosylase